jgi:uncharacterized membrane protein
MIRLLKLYLLTLGVFFALDLLWLGVLAKGFYRNQLGPLLAEQTLWPAAILFYLVYIAGLLTFVVLPGLADRSPKHSLGRGAAFGLVTYCTYELTNLALIRDWPLALVPVDILWGVVLCAGVAQGSVSLARRLGLA